MSMLIREEGLEAMQSDLRNNQRINQIKDAKGKDKCIMRGACHDLDDCSVFMSQTVQDRRKVLFRNKLCYGCYGCISKDHSSRNCKHQQSCKICKEKHPTSLHRFKPKKERVKQDSGNDDNKQMTITIFVL